MHFQTRLANTRPYICVCHSVCVSRYNGTILAYGQTGAGKTHTMMGPKGDYSKRGIVPRVLKHFFKRLHDTTASDDVVVVRVSDLEIYVMCVSTSLYVLISSVP